MSVADVLANLTPFGQKAADVSKPPKAVRVATRRAARSTLRAYVPVAAESVDGEAKRLEFEATERRILKARGYRCGVDGCTDKAVTLHHLKLRSQGGTNDDENLIPICRRHHIRLHNHPAEAAKLGLIVRREGSGLTKGINNI